MTKAVLFRLMPTFLFLLALVATLGVLAAKLVDGKTRMGDDALLTQWNETERLALAWSEAMGSLARALTDLDDLRMIVDVGEAEIRYVEGNGEGTEAWSSLAPGTALVLRTGLAGRFEGRLPRGGFLQAKELGLKAFPTTGEGLAFLRRAEDGAVFVLAPRSESIVIAHLPTRLVATLLASEPRASGVTWALVAAPGPWSSQAPPARAPTASGAVVYANDTIAFTQQMFALGSKLRSLLEGPSRFELQERKGALSFRLSGMGSAPVGGTNLRIITQWRDEFLPSRLLMPLVHDLGLLSVALVILAGVAFFERARFLAAGRGLKEAVRGVLYQRETVGAADWTLAPFVKEEFGDILRNVNRVTIAHRSLHGWGNAWARGFDTLAGDEAAFFRPVREVASSLGFEVLVTHDTEWQLYVAACPSLDAVLMLVVRAVDFRTELVRTFLSHAMEPIAGAPGRSVEDARRELIVWLEKAGGLAHEEDPLVWGVFSWGAETDASGSRRWTLAGRAGRAGLAVITDTSPMRLQWGDELIGELTPKAPPAWRAATPPEVGAGEKGNTEVTHPPARSRSADVPVALQALAVLPAPRPEPETASEPESEPGSGTASVPEQASTTFAPPPPPKAALSKTSAFPDAPASDEDLDPRGFDSFLDAPDSAHPLSQIEAYDEESDDEDGPGGGLGRAS